jgi:hypothetical protein
MHRRICPRRGEEEGRQRNRPKKCRRPSGCRRRHPSLRSAPLQRQRTWAASACPPVGYAGYRFDCQFCSTLKAHPVGGRGCRQRADRDRVKSGSE